MSPPVLAPIEPAFAEAASFTEATLDALLPKPSGPESRLLEAMRYATMGGGKRLRAFFVLQSGRLFGVDRRALGRVAAAVECVHSYSLVHDDLPAMDDDDVRRGKPSVHKAFDEATAILAGDALLTLAFGLVSSPEAHGDPFVRCELIAKLAQAAGHGGMVGGQMMDIVLEGETSAAARDHAARAHEDRRAGDVLLRSGRRHGQGVGRGAPGALRPTARKWASRTRSPTTFSISKARRPRPARTSARMQPGARRPSSPSSVRTG